MVNQLQELLLRQDSDAQLLRLLQLAASIFSRDEAVRLLGHGTCHASAVLLDQLRDFPAPEMTQRARDDEAHIGQFVALCRTLLCCRRDAELLQFAANLCIAFVLEIRTDGCDARFAHITHRENRFIGRIF